MARKHPRARTESNPKTAQIRAQRTSRERGFALTGARGSPTRCSATSQSNARHSPGCGTYTGPMTQKEQRERPGRNDLDLEDELVDEATATVTEGAERLNRKWA